MSFEEWFKQEFNREPKDHNELDGKLERAWNRGFVEGRKTWSKPLPVASDWEQGLND